MAVTALSLITETRMVNRVTGAAEGIYYGWQGDTDTTYVEHYFLTNAPTPGTIFWIGPFRLIALSFDLFSLRWYCRRWRGPVTWVAYAAYRATRWADRCYRRLIITAAVWGLADYQQSNVPSWRDLHIAKRVRHG